MNGDGIRGGSNSAQATPPQRSLPVRATLFGARKSRSTFLARANLERVLQELGFTLEAIEICDMVENAERAFREGILATPTLVLQTIEGDHRVLIAGTLDNTSALVRALKEFDHQNA